VSCLSLVVVSLWDKILTSAVTSLGVSSGFRFSIVSIAATPACRILHIVVYLST
jgi:hypothetical protein